MTASGIETATFRLVTECLNQMRHQQRTAIYNYRVFKLRHREQAWRSEQLHAGPARLQGHIMDPLQNYRQSVNAISVNTCRLSVSCI